MKLLLKMKEKGEESSELIALKIFLEKGNRN